MQMKKKILAAALTGLLASSGAFAVDLDVSPSNATVYASELVSAGTQLTDAALAVNSKLGFGVSAGQTRYVRIDLGNATLGTAATGASLSVTEGLKAVVSKTVVQGGAPTDNFVIIQFTADNDDDADVLTAPVGADYSAAAALAVSLAGAKVTSAASPVTVTYSLYEDAPSAAAGGASGRIYSKSGNLATFGTGLKFSVTAGTNTASVEEDFKKFTSDSLSPTLAAVGAVTIDVNSAQTPAGAPVALPDLVIAGTKLVVAGDFSAVDDTVHGGVFLGNALCAASAFDGVLNTAKTQVTLTTDDNTVAGAKLCFAATGTNVIEEQTITGALDVTPAASTTTADVAAQTVGTILHDGTRLMAPLVQVPSGWISRIVLANTGSRDRTYNLSVQGEDGNAITTGAVTGTIKAGKTVVLNSADVLTAFSASPRATVIATIAAPNTQIQGLYQIVNPTSGSISNHVMVRPGTN